MVIPNMKKLKMKRTLILTLLPFIMVVMNSCLKKGLPEYENWDQNNIDNVYVEYRYEGNKMMNGKPVVEYKRLDVEKKVNTSNNSIELKIQVPAASGSFTDDIRKKVQQNYLWMYTDISTAAKIAPIGDTPKLGDPGDLTKDLHYRVTAANGTTRDWVINVVTFKN
jgi:hypothetical protein